MNVNKLYDGYEKLKTVGQGAFGTAILCRRIKDGEHVVMKEIFTLNMDNSEKRATLNEVEILSTLDHQNIIKYMSSFRKDESLVIIMEYANGGNLAQLINSKKNNNQIFMEKSVLNIVSQITAAIKYIHSKKILHRDLKTANIFLNMAGAVKVGDFGISKMLNTKSQAHTVVGTPYYLSPEMCEGSDYNEKSDVWAIGCILYELCCLKKPFEASTLPVLVQKITKCVYDDIPDTYSKELSDLVKCILQKHINLRPSAKYINEIIIPKVLRKIQATTTNFPFVDLKKLSNRSILYYLTDFINPSIVPIELPHRKIIDFSLSSTHYMSITDDNIVYVWGANQHGQLGLGDDEDKNRPVTVNILKEQKIIKCVAGKGFSLFLTEEGNVLSCGDGSQGCLGHGSWNSLKYPAIIVTLKNTIISQLACGEDHVAALSSEGRCFTWGSSKFGQLGQGHTQNRCKPLTILLRDFSKIINVYCGCDSTMLVAANGQLYVAGSNNYNKLGISKFQQINLFTPLINIKNKIKCISIGINHTAMITDQGTIIFMGRNTEGQFGKGNFHRYNEPEMLKLKNKVVAVACGTNYTLAIDSKNVVWFWGIYYKQIDELLGKSQYHLKTDNYSSVKSLIHEKNITDIVKEPHSILALYSSPKNIKNGNIIYFGQVFADSDGCILLTHTTIPPPIKEFSGGGSDTSDSGYVRESTTLIPSVMTNLPNTPRI